MDRKLLISMFDELLDAYKNSASDWISEAPMAQEERKCEIAKLQQKTRRWRKKFIDELENSRG